MHSELGIGDLKQIWASLKKFVVNFINFHSFLHQNLL